MPSAQLNITPLEPIVDFSYYQNSGEWQLIGNNAVLYEYIPMLYLFAVCCVITRSTLHILMFVRPSVCAVDRQQQRRPAALLLRSDKRRQQISMLPHDMRAT